MKFIAHLRDDGDDQSVEAHLLGVAEKAKSRAAKIGLDVQGELIGQLHDLGKYSAEFQDYIRSAAPLWESFREDQFPTKSPWRKRVCRTYYDEHYPSRR